MYVCVKELRFSMCENRRGLEEKWNQRECLRKQSETDFLSNRELSGNCFFLLLSPLFTASHSNELWSYRLSIYLKDNTKTKTK